MAEQQTVTRKNSAPIYVWVLPEEKKAIEAKAETCGMSVSAYLRNVGIGMPVKSVLDHARIADLSKVNADQGRLGGLLKLWLTNDEKLKLQDRALLEMNIRGLLDDIQAAQEVLLEKAKSI